MNAYQQQREAVLDHCNKANARIVGERIADALWMSLSECDAQDRDTFDQDTLELIAKTIQPAIKAGWDPSSEELETLCEGEESEMRAVEQAIPAGIGGKLAVLLDQIADDARYCDE